MKPKVWVLKSPLGNTQESLETSAVELEFHPPFFFLKKQQNERNLKYCLTMTEKKRVRMREGGKE